MDKVKQALDKHCVLDEQSKKIIKIAGIACLVGAVATTSIIIAYKKYAK